MIGWRETMASIIVNKGTLWMSIYHNSKRYRKSLYLKDTLSNRKKAQRILDNTVAKIQLGEVVLEDRTPTFEYYAKIYLLNKKKKLKGSPTTNTSKLL